MSEAQGPVVRTEARGAVLVITLNRPEARNAVNGAVALAMAEALDRLDADGSLMVGVLTGAGQGFCAGMDLKGFADGVFPVAGDRGFAGIVKRSSRKPLIAAVEGFALGGGLEVALSCDIIVVGTGARLGSTEATFGVFPAAGALLRLPRRVGRGRTSLLALSAQPVDAEEGYRMGLVDRLVERGGALAEAIDLAETIARNAPLAVIASKEALGYSHLSDDDFWTAQEKPYRDVFASKDALEGARAFAEKRPPRWQGA